MFSMHISMLVFPVSILLNKFTSNFCQLRLMIDIFQAALC